MRIVLGVLPFALAGGVAAVILATTGSDSSSSGATHTTATVDTQAQERAQAIAKYERCRRSTRPLLNKLHDLDSRLDIGLNYDEYTDKVGDVRVAYDQVTPRLGSQTECITAVGIPAEAAFNQYVKASNIWGDCFDDIDCETDAIEPELHKHWSKASNAIHSADGGLSALRDPN
jgi:hypothetical protein